MRYRMYNFLIYAVAVSRTSPIFLKHFILVAENQVENRSVTLFYMNKKINAFYWLNEGEPN
jgi:hypothetical protein